MKTGNDKIDIQYQHLFYPLQFVWNLWNHDIKTLRIPILLRLYPGNLIDLIRLQVAVGDEWLKLLTHCCCFEKNFVSDGNCGEDGLHFKFSIVPMTLNYSGIIFFLNKLKFDHINIFKSFLDGSRKPLTLSRKLLTLVPRTR